MKYLLRLGLLLGIIFITINARKAEPQMIITRKIGATKPGIVKKDRIITRAPKVIKPDISGVITPVRVINPIDKRVIIEKLDEQLSLPIDDAWQEKVDNLLLDLSLIDRTLAGEYSKIVRKKIAAAVAQKPVIVPAETVALPEQPKLIEPVETEVTQPVSPVEKVVLPQPEFVKPIESEKAEPEIIEPVLMPAKKVILPQPEFIEPVESEETEPEIIEPILIPAKKVISPQQPKFIKHTETGVISPVDKNEIIERLNDQLLLPVNDLWQERVDDLLFDLSLVDKEMAKEYAQRIRRKIADALTKTEPVAPEKEIASEKEAAVVPEKEVEVVPEKEVVQISPIDKDVIIKKLEEELLLPVDDEWRKRVDDLLFDLASVDREMAREYSQKVHKKVTDAFAKITEPVVEKPIIPVKEAAPVVEKPEEKISEETTGAVAKGTPPSRGKPPVRGEKKKIESAVPKEEAVSVQPTGSLKDPAQIEAQLKQLLQEPVEQRTSDWLQNIKDLIFALSAFDVKKASSYLDEVYISKINKPGTTPTTTTLVQKEPERPKKLGDIRLPFGGRAPSKGPVTKLSNEKDGNDKILKIFNQYLNALSDPDAWVKGKEGGNPAQWWLSDIDVYEKVINEKKLEVRTDEEKAKEVAAKTTKEAIAKAIQQQKDREIKELRSAIEVETNKARQGKSPSEKAEITKEFNKKREEEIEKIKTTSVDEDKIREEIKKSVNEFSEQAVKQKVQARVAHIRAEYQAAEKGFTLEELENLTAEVTEDIKERHPILPDQQIQRLVDLELPQARKNLLEEKQMELEELTQQLTNKIKAANSALTDADVRAAVRAQLPQAKQELAEKKAVELQTLTQQLTEQIKESNEALSESDVQTLVKEQLKQIKKQQREQKAEQRAKDIAAQELKELKEKIDKLFEEPEPNEVKWILEIRGKIKELYKIDQKLAKEYQKQFLEIVPGEKPFL